MCIESEFPETVDGAMENKKIVLKARPNGIFQPDTDVELVTEKLALSLTGDKEDDETSKACPDDHVVVKVATLSVDAFIRTMLDEEAYHGSVALGMTLPAIGYGTVVRAGKKSPIRVGNKVVGMMGAQSYACVPAKELFPRINYLGSMPSSACLGLMGLTTGMTAYVGCFYVLPPPRRGQTVVVTGATGAVGSTAVQLLKITGARVVGIAGGPKKNAFLRDTLMTDGAIDYKDMERSMDEQLAKACPDGIDFIYDNVGGETLDTLLAHINPGGKVVICGAISQYQGNLNKGKVQGPGNYLKLAERGATMKGFNVIQYSHKLLWAQLGMLWYYLTGRVKLAEHIEDGVESFPFALAKMFSGGHIGKLLVKVSEE